MKMISSTLLLVVFSATMVMSQDGQRPKPPEPASMSKAESGPTAPERSPAEKYFSDVELINQDGQKMRFYTDVLKNKVVVINTFFTTCTGICPPMNRNFEKIQDALGDRLGKDLGPRSPLRGGGLRSYLASAASFAAQATELRHLLG